MKRLSYNEVKQDLQNRGYDVVECKEHITVMGTNIGQKWFDNKTQVVTWHRLTFVEFDLDKVVSTRESLLEMLETYKEGSESYRDTQDRIKNLNILIASEGHPVTRECVVSILKKAGYTCGSYDTTRVRGWHEYHGDFKVQDSVNGTVWVIMVWNYKAKEDILDKWATLLIGAGLNVERREHEIWVSKIPVPAH